MKTGFLNWLVSLVMATAAFGETRNPAKETEVDLGGGVKLELVSIPAGSIMMADRSTRHGRVPKPPRKTEIKPFYLGKYEVTQEQWEVLMTDNPSEFKGAKNPVEQVSWNDCQLFLKKLNTKAGRKNEKFTLPTEAQWEHACRAGSTAENAGGDDESEFGEYAWYKKNADRKTHPVGEKKPNAFGLYDMHGNVWEWCADWFDHRYPEAPNEDDWPTRARFRIVRGGAFYSDFALLRRFALRADVPPDDKRSFMGFRISLIQEE